MFVACCCRVANTTCRTGAWPAAAARKFAAWVAAAHGARDAQLGAAAKGPRSGRPGWWW